MRKYKIIQLAIMLAVLVLEILPYGAVCNFSVAPESGGGFNRVTYSYFSMTPFGYANFGPLLTAILTCGIIVLLILSLITNKRGVMVTLTILSGVAVLTSILPLMFGISYFSVIASLITCLICAETILGIYAIRCKKQI